MKWFILIVLGTLALSACTNESIDSFEDCANAGNPVMESYPRQCAVNGEVFVEEIDEVACTAIYEPVCGEVEVECISEPCYPINVTFSNGCEAQKAGAQNIVEGPCSDEINPEGACLSFDGRWIEEAKECEGMWKELCEDLGGKHDDCASACRNDPDAEICTMQCVNVCSFK